MPNEDKYSTELTLLRDRLNRALSGLVSEQLMGAERVLPICHRLFELIEAVQAEKRRIIKQAPVVCAFCGHEERTLEGARNHIKTCEKHPMYEFRKEFRQKTEK